ncbi:MAG: hypothetical protein K5770_12430 [Lachnospiraceae bacterium]|nr:hypothetical protein [Lachnospiraceae bacterium]
MLKEIKLVAKEDIFLEYEDEKGKGQVLFSAIKPYWDYSCEEDYEGGFAHIVDDKRVLAVLSVASGQGGVVIVWNTETGTPEHISQADFCQAAAIYNGEVYTLAIVRQFGAEPSAVVEKCKYGTMDAFAECESVQSISMDCFDDYRGNTEELSLIVDESGIRLFLKDKEI